MACDNCGKSFDKVGSTFFVLVPEKHEVVDTEEGTEDVAPSLKDLKFDFKFCEECLELVHQIISTHTFLGTIKKQDKAS